MATVITLVEHTGDALHIQGQVNGVTVDAYGWVSATNGMTKLQKIAYVQGLLNAAIATPAIDVTTSFQ